MHASWGYGVFVGQTHQSAPTVLGVFTPPSPRFACATSSINRGELKSLCFTLKFNIPSNRICNPIDLSVRVCDPRRL